MVNKTETEEFLAKNRQKASSKFYSRWWNQGYSHQRFICRTVESIVFRALVIFLVVTDTALVIAEVMLDSYKIHFECGTENGHHQQHSSAKPDHISRKRVETAMEIAHYASIGILVFFILELIIRVYASGKDFWNIRRRKMEYFDAFIVITSLGIDLYILNLEEKIFGENLILMLSFRLWRFVRIISSVAEGIRHGESKHKEHLNRQYLKAIHRLVDLLKYKTDYLNQNNEDINSVSERFQLVDNRCQSLLDELDHNHVLTSSAIVAQFIEQLEEIENRGDGTAIGQMLIKPTAV